MRASRMVWTIVACGMAVGACASDDGTDSATGDEGGEAASCAVADLELVSAGTLTVATGEPAFEPWVVDDDPTNKEGFEAAVTYALAAELGFADADVTWIRTGFDEAIAPGKKEFDLNVQQYSITEERDAVVDFSAPYYLTNQAIIGFADSDIAAATTLEDLRSYDIGAAIGTTSLDYVETVISPEAPASVFDDNALAITALQNHQIDGVVLDLPTAYFQVAVNIPDAAIIGVFDVAAEQADELGYLMQDGSGLKPCVDEALGRLRAAGTLDELADRWLVTGGDLPTIGS